MDPLNIYLATPYTHEDPDVRRMRYQGVTNAAGRLMARGHLVYSPITHGHVITEASEAVSHDWPAWEKHCLSFIEKWCDELWILAQDRWTSSVGVKAEALKALELGKRVVLYTPNADVKPASPNLSCPAHGGIFYNPAYCFEQDCLKWWTDDSSPSGPGYVTTCRNCSHWPGKEEYRARAKEYLLSNR